jgi:hypothetical protein
MLDIQDFIRTFNIYSKSFLDTNEDYINKNINLKITHTKKVLKNCTKIAISEGLNSEDQFIAELCGLFHDIGRFEQFTKYKTFRDEDSLYHGQIGVDVIKKESFLRRLPRSTQDIIITSVYNHGLISIPENTIGKKIYFSKLVRDADKIDIFRIVSKYYKSSGPRNIVLEYGLEDSPIISESVMQKFKAKQLIEKQELNTLNDFKAMQLAWIFDLNFDYTKKTIFESEHLNVVLESISNVEQREILRKEIKSFYGE